MLNQNDLLQAVESLADKFSESPPQTTGDQKQRARHMILGVMETITKAWDQEEFLVYLEKGNGGTPEDLMNVVLKFIIEKQNEIQAARTRASRIVEGLPEKND